MGQAIPQRGVTISEVCFSDASNGDDVAKIEGSPEEIAETLKRIETVRARPPHLMDQDEDIEYWSRPCCIRPSDQWAGGGKHGQIRVCG